MHLVETEVCYMYTKHNKSQRQGKNIFSLINDLSH